MSEANSVRKGARSVTDLVIRIVRSVKQSFDSLTFELRRLPRERRRSLSVPGGRSPPASEMDADGRIFKFSFESLALLPRRASGIKTIRAASYYSK